ncbi:MAG: hypothetical protein GF329_22605 [Candidatus Lokiarchaeota archaeon]|nr:hypothetical protein [Candidatus Lokiarchaeota archaeon]
MGDKSLHKIRHRLALNKEKLNNLDFFDDIEYSNELKTFQQDIDWYKKSKEEELRGYKEGNWHEGNYDF